MNGVDHRLGPFEGHRVWIVAGDERVDGLPHLARRGEARAAERSPAQYAKPALDLIEPAGMSRREVEVHGRVLGEPAVVLGLVRVEIVQHDVDLLAGVGRDHLVHEGQELAAAAAVRVLGHRHLAGQHVERSEEGGGPVPFVLVADAVDGLPVGQAQVPLRPFERLDVWFLIDREHHGMLRRVQVEPHDVGGLRGKLGVGTDAPRPPALQVDPPLAQDPPDVAAGHGAEGLGQERAGPRGVSRGRGLVELLQNLPFGCPVVLAGPSPARRVLDPGNPLASKSGAPLRDHGGPEAEGPRNRGGGLPVGGRQDNLRPLYQSVLRARAPNPALQRLLVLRQQSDYGRVSHTQ